MATIVGNAANNALYGTNSADWIYGYAGNDYIYSGLGDDHVFGGNGNDVIHDIAGNNEIYGGAGNDSITAGNGDDYVSGGAGNDRLDTGSGNDRVHGGEGNDVIWGGAGDDYVFGGTGSDTIYGGAGADQLSGGPRDGSADRFIFETIFDSEPTDSDAIIDFEVRVDRLDLSAIDANAITSGNQAFRIVENFSGSAGELRIQEFRFNSSNQYLVTADVNGDGQADFELFVGLSFQGQLSAYDFVL